VRLVRASNACQQARILSRNDPARTRRFAPARVPQACSDYAPPTDAKPFLQTWLGEQLDRHVLHKLATRADGAANRLLVGKARRVRCQGTHQIDTVEGQTHDSGQRWCGQHVAWLGLVVPARIDQRATVVAQGLAWPVTYVRRVRRKLGERHRLSAQLVGEGHPYPKPQHILGQGIVGLDLVLSH
jgi:putative transposase